MAGQRLSHCSGAHVPSSDVLIIILHIAAPALCSAAQFCSHLPANELHIYQGLSRAIKGYQGLLARRRAHRGEWHLSGFRRFVLAGAIIAAAAGVTQLRAQSVLSDPKDAPKVFASTCSACHKSPQGLAKSGQVAGFLRQHYTTGAEMSAAMAAYLVAAGNGPAGKKGAATATVTPGEEGDAKAKAREAREKAKEAREARAKKQEQ